jgi:hypothetical protein
MQVPPRISITEADTDGDGVADALALSFGVDGSQVEIAGPIQVHQISGSPDPRSQEVIDSPIFALLLQLAFEAQLKNQKPATIPLDFLGGLQLAPVLRPTSRVVSGALLIGLDVTWDVVIAGLVPVYPFATSAPVDTRGDRSELADFLGGGDLGFVVNPNQFPIYFADAMKQIKDKIPDNVTIDRIDLVPKDGLLRIEGSAREVANGIELGTANFSFDAIPALTTERFFTFRERLRFAIRNVHVDVHLSAVARFLEVMAGILTVGATALGIEQIVAAIQGGLVHNIAGQGGTFGARDPGKPDPAARNRQITLTGTTKPVIDLRIETFTFHSDELISTIRLRPRLGTARLSGASRIFGNPVQVEVFYACTFPVDLLPSDPQLHVAWTLRRLDSNTAVDAKDGSAAENRSYRAKLRLSDAAGPPSMSLDCRVYRTLGTTLENLFHKTITLKPTDRLDHSHPYVHWQGTVPLPVFVKRADGSLTRNGLASVDRKSKIHRTDLPGRCLFADSYGPVITEHPDYLDDLPFPKAELAHHRHLVCDYCFFGGPDKT